MMRLSALVGDSLEFAAESDAEIKGLTADSRNVMPGYLFAALPGFYQDGCAFISQAIKRGAAALLVPHDINLESYISNIESRDAVTVLRDRNPRQRFSLLAARFFCDQPKVIAAITGTNGKTSVANFTRQIWSRLNCRAASLGTLGLSAPGHHESASLTTPDPVKIHQILKDLVAEGVDYLAIEASSHGLDQYRLDGLELTAAAFTNFSQDHLDYHKDLDHYFLSKLRLFVELLSPSGVAVINVDDDKASDIKNAVVNRGQRLIEVGSAASPKGENIKLISQSTSAHGQRLRITHAQRNYDINLPLVGDFQISNALMAAGLVIACGADAALVFEALKYSDGVPGRLQHIGQSRNGAPVFVDYAHTPDALKNVLSAVRLHTVGTLHVLFGVGGDRDRQKRPLMALVAKQYADNVVVTDDNPRTEDAAEIRAEILAANPEAIEISGRAAAIEYAITLLQEGDVLVVAGKGHETVQIVGDKIIPFSDEKEVQRALIAQGGSL